MTSPYTTAALEKLLGHREPPPPMIISLPSDEYVEWHLLYEMLYHSPSGAVVRDLAEATGFESRRISGRLRALCNRAILRKVPASEVASMFEDEKPPRGTGYALTAASLRKVVGMR
jgi:hypothetical protein